jgi:cell division protein FtsL
MNHLSSFLVALVLVVSSAALIVWHVRIWQQFQAKEMGERERNFRRRQFRRRVQTSALLGLLGGAILLGQLLFRPTQPHWFLVLYWSGVLLLVLWIALLATADMVATAFYYSRERSECAVQQAKLHAELRKARNGESHGHNGNGRA